MQKNSAIPKIRFWEEHIFRGFYDAENTNFLMETGRSIAIRYKQEKLKCPDFLYPNVVSMLLLIKQSNFSKWPQQKPC